MDYFLKEKSYIMSHLWKWFPRKLNLIYSTFCVLCLLLCWSHIYMCNTKCKQPDKYNFPINLNNFLDNTCPIITYNTQYKFRVAGRQSSRLCHSRGELYLYIIHVLSRKLVSPEIHLCLCSCCQPQSITKCISLNRLDSLRGQNNVILWS